MVLLSREAQLSCGDQVLLCCQHALILASHSCTIRVLARYAYSIFMKTRLWQQTAACDSQLGLCMTGAKVYQGQLASGFWHTALKSLPRPFSLAQAMRGFLSGTTMATSVLS